MFCHLGLFFCLGASVTLRGGALGVHRGGGEAGCCAVMLYVGDGLGGSNQGASLSSRLSILHRDTHNQTGPLWCWFPSGWACAHSRPPWVSPTTSPVRLGVSPAAAPTPTGVFSQRFEALFPCAGALGCAAVCFAPSVCPVYLCMNVGPQGATHCSACPALRHSESGPLGLSAGMWGRRVC